MLFALITNTYMINIIRKALRSFSLFFEWFCRLFQPYNFFGR